MFPFRFPSVFRGLTYIPDLSRFSMLRCVWLNNNKVRLASFNCCLTELYLQNNDILSISGQHLTCLQVLLLSNNQMKCLEETVSELKNMQDLHTLCENLRPPSLFKSINHLKQEERRRAFKLFSVERQRVLDTIAFGRRALPPPTGRRVTNSITKPLGKLRFSSITENYSLKYQVKTF
uniref:Uncharacterized protein n=1 Tax=Cyprinus carpio carpio TaxID=630221 RepID=A0A8C0YEW6_CYPCA